VAAGDVLADALHVGNVRHRATPCENVGCQGVAETMGVDTSDLRLPEDWRQHSLGNPT
jgi:hypothetical protein